MTWADEVEDQRRDLEIDNQRKRRHEAAREAQEMATKASNATLIHALRVFADDIESEGRARVPQWMREAARRLDVVRSIEDELREQASGSQDGYLLDVANRLHDALKHHSS